MTDDHLFEEENQIILYQLFGKDHLIKPLFKVFSSRVKE